MIMQIPEDALVIFDRGYNSGYNVNLLGHRKYIGALTLSDHMDLVDLPIGEDSFIETQKHVYGKNHRIILYHSSKLQKRRVSPFMKTFGKVYMKVNRTIESGRSDAMDKARIYLESQNLNKTIVIPDLSIDHERVARRVRMLGLNALFTRISDLKAKEDHIQQELESRGLINSQIKALIENMPETERTGILASIIELALKERDKKESEKN